MKSSIRLFFKANDLDYLAMVGKCCYLMSEINEKQNNFEAITQWLDKARDTYSRVLKKAKLEDSGSVDEHKIWMSKY